MIQILFEDYMKDNKAPIMQKHGTFAQLPVLNIDHQNPVQFLPGYIKVRTNEKWKTLKAATIKIKLIGQIETNTTFPTVFLNKRHNVEKIEEIDEERITPFVFLLDQTYDTMAACNFRIVYFLKAVLFENKVKVAETTEHFAVRIPRELFNPMPMYDIELGIEGCIHLRVELSQIEYYLDDTLVGRLTIILSKIETKVIELLLLKTEDFLAKSNGKEGISTEMETLHETVLKKGPVKKEEIIPFKINLGSLCLEPTVNGIEESYYLNYQLKLIVRRDNDMCFFKYVPFKLSRRPEVNVKAH